ncbi:MAG TPA: PilT/PilU family type 4a pilus ATPase [bacterium]|nr:PilT/PilU family type 4a pilus ATPase [bacterium]
MIFEKFSALLAEMISTKVPDLHIASGIYPHIRKHDGEIHAVEEFGPVSASDVRAILVEMLGSEKFKHFEMTGDADFSYSYGEHRFRVNASADAYGHSLALRAIPTEIPSCETLQIPPALIKLLDRGKGLILVTGPTGSGKSTTLASMIDYINQTYRRHIITIEDPIEFNFRNKQCLIHQREIGSHTQSFSRAMRASLREDPDVIMVGEMRDPETIAAAMTLAETGHMVLSTLHTNDSVQSVDRIIDSFPTEQQNQIRTQLAMSLTAILSQILIPKKDTQGRVAARELLINNDAVRSVIMQGATHRLYGVLELYAQEGMFLMDQYLERLFMNGQITKDTLLSRVRDPDLVAHIAAK